MVSSMLERITCPPLMSPLGRHLSHHCYLLLVGVDLIEWFGAESAVSGSAAQGRAVCDAKVYMVAVIVCGLA